VGKVELFKRRRKKMKKSTQKASSGYERMVARELSINRKDHYFLSNNYLGRSGPREKEEVGKGGYHKKARRMWQSTQLSRGARKGEFSESNLTRNEAGTEAGR